MKRMRHMALSALLMAIATTLTACAPPVPQWLAGTALVGKVQVDCSSTVYPFSEAAAARFKEEFPNIKLSVGISGTGGGFKRFTQGEIDISNASRPIKWEEFQQCRRSGVAFLELPIAYDGLTIAVHPSNDWVDRLTVDQLRQIYLEGGAQRWSDLQAGWPDLPIKVFSPGKDSGTYDYFREVMLEGQPGASMRDKVSESEDDNFLVTGVAGEVGAIAFFGAAYLFENPGKIRAVPIVNPATGEAVMPTPETIEQGSYAPFSRPLLLYVRAQSMRRPEMRKFIAFQLEQADRLAPTVGYVALPDTMYELAARHVENRFNGTHFYTADGKKVTGSLAELYREENLVDIQ